MYKSCTSLNLTHRIHFHYSFQEYSTIWTAISEKICFDHLPEALEAKILSKNFSQKRTMKPPSLFLIANLASCAMVALCHNKTLHLIGLHFCSIRGSFKTAVSFAGRRKTWRQWRIAFQKVQILCLDTVRSTSVAHHRGKNNTERYFKVICHSYLSACIFCEAKQERTVQQLEVCPI